MAQDHGLCRKEKQSNGPGARAATAGPCCSCQRDSSCSLQTAGPNTDPGAHGMNRGSKQKQMNGAKQLEAIERGQELMRAVGMAGKG